MADTLPGILAIFNNVAPGREAEFEEWFQHEHLAERIAVPGFLLGRRYEALSGQPRYLNFYLTQSAAVLKSTAYLERLDNPSVDFSDKPIHSSCYSLVRIARRAPKIASQIMCQTMPKPSKKQKAETYIPSAVFFGM